MEEKENEELKNTESIVNGEETNNTELNAEPESKDKQNEELKSKDVKSTQTSEIQKEGEDTKNNETNVEQEQPEVLNDSAQKKKSKKPLIITIIVLVVLVLCALGGFFIWKYIKENESVGTTWGDTYYAYLKEGTEQKDYASREKYGLQQNMSNVTLQFAEIEEDKAPAMIMNYEENDANYVNVYHINNENKVVNVSYKEPSKVELLYNIELKQYIWYVHVEKANEDLYMPIKVDEEKLTENAQNNLDDNVIDNTENYNNTTSGEKENTNSLGEIVSTEMTADIAIGKDAETTVEKLDGTTATLPKFDETFVKPEVDASQEISVDINNVDKTELKDAIKETVSGYKPEEEIVTDEVEEQVSEKVEEVEEIKQEIEDAIEEIEKKEEEERKAAEEAKKKAEEEARKKAEKASNGKISEEQARKLAQKIDGTYSEEMDSPISYMLEAMIKDSSGLEYYLFRVRWLVENTHWSTIDGVAISVDGQKWKQVDIYHNYTNGETIQEVFREGIFE